MLNEEKTYEELYSNEDVIEKLGEIDVYDSEKKSFVKMDPTEIMGVCSNALYKIQRDYPFLYQFITKCKLMYIPVFPSQIANTMAVDAKCNLWINLTFVYDDCKMDVDRVFGILFHELFHIFFDHLLRFEAVYPKSTFAAAGPEVYKKANKKANLCMDYEVNASMVEDGIVTADFWKVMNGLYKKEYTGMTWEEILKKYGDQEYDEWRLRNGEKLDDIESKILEAIEKASKILLDPESDEDDKRFARKELQKTLDELLGKREKGEKTLQDSIDELAKTKLADHGDIASNLEDVSDDLNRSPENMSTEELDKTLRDMDKLIDSIEEEAEDVGRDFGKSADDVHSDAEKARKALKDAMKKINEGGLTKDEKKDLIEKAKDALEDVISDEMEKEKLKKKREERDAKKEAERKEKLKKVHPLRKIIIVMKNLADLKKLGLISDQTEDALNRCINEIEPLTEKLFKDMKKSDLKVLTDALNDLEDSLLPDLVALIENETILQKTEADMKELLEIVFDHVFNAFRKMFDSSLDEKTKGALIKTAAMKLRNIGKILKTQKKWRVGDDFKEAYKEEMKRLMEIRKTGGDKALFKELYDLGVIDPMMLDSKGQELLDELESGSGSSDDGDDERKTKTKAQSYTDQMAEWDGTDEEVKPYEGKLYYMVYKSDVGDTESTELFLSDEPDYLKDADFEQFGLKFEKDFPEYWVEELQESVFEVLDADTDDYADVDSLKKKLEDHPDYEKGSWDTEE